ncbi:MAG: hypothetical protein K6T73_01140 [Candidatus Bathyarchaeota archaeon]|nr:hypothetical protein [Candidatus Bathyarchaeota archaeon]
MITFSPYGEVGYGVKVTIPCITINTPFGPVKIGGQCTPEMTPVTKDIPVPEAKPAINVMPLVLLGGAGIAAMLVISRKKKGEEKK